MHDDQCVCYAMLARVSACRIQICDTIIGTENSPGYTALTPDDELISIGSESSDSALYFQTSFLHNNAVEYSSRIVLNLTLMPSFPMPC